MCQKSGMFDEAIHLFRKAAGNNPRHALSHYNLGFALYFGKSRSEEALQEFNKAIALDKNMAPAWYAAGHVLLYKKRELDESLKLLTRAIQINPRMAEAYNTLGIIEIKNQKWSAARERFKQALAIRPDYDAACCNGAIACMYQGKTREALEYAERYAELQPNSVLAHRNLANMYGAAGKHKLALCELDIARAMNPADWILYFWKGCLLLQLNDFEKAVVSFQEAIQYKGSFALSYYNLALCYEALKRKDLAKVYIEKAIELNPALGKDLI